MLVFFISSLLFALVFSEKGGFRDILPDTYPEMVARYTEMFNVAAKDKMILFADGTPATYLEDSLDPDLFTFLKMDTEKAPYTSLWQRFRDGAHVKGKDGKVQFKTGLMPPQFVSTFLQ